MLLASAALGSICLEASLQREQPDPLRSEPSAAGDVAGFMSAGFRAFRQKICFYCFSDNV